MEQPKPVILSSRLERYSKNFGLWKGNERNGEWEFEILAPRAWVEEVKRRSLPATFGDLSRKSAVAWWTPTEDAYDAFQMPYSSYSAAHVYIEKTSRERITHSRVYTKTLKRHNRQPGPRRMNYCLII